MSRSELILAAQAKLGREEARIAMGVESCRELLNAIGNPHDHFRAIHIVGTNGKSTTTDFIATMLSKQGFKVGEFISPHLITFNERIRINGEPVDDPTFCEHLDRVIAVADSRLCERRTTLFELLTAVGFSIFAGVGVDIVVVEAGLGGRLDSTNVLDAELVVLTNVALDHREYLGDTISEIAREKLAVVKVGRRLLLGTDNPIVVAEAKQTIANINGVELLQIDDFPKHAAVASIELPAFLKDNLELAATAVELISQAVTDELVIAAAAEVLPGRAMRIGRAPETILDGAHNPAAIDALISSLSKRWQGRNVVVVLSILMTKDAGGMINSLADFVSSFIVTDCGDCRARSVEEIQEMIEVSVTKPVEVELDVSRAIDLARTRAGAEGSVLITGSLALVGAVVKQVELER